MFPRRSSTPFLFDSGAEQGAGGRGVDWRTGPTMRARTRRGPSALPRGTCHPSTSIRCDGGRETKRRSDLNASLASRRAFRKAGARNPFSRRGGIRRARKCFCRFARNEIIWHHAEECCRVRSSISRSGFILDCLEATARTAGSRRKRRKHTRARARAKQRFHFLLIAPFKRQYKSHCLQCSSRKTDYRIIIAMTRDE